jgi:hypothetical protein
VSAQVDAGTYFVRVFGDGDTASVSIDVRSLIRACNDGVDNDADGRIDLADAGCFGGTDDDETDPAVVPACADGIDNDADGATDAPAIRLAASHEFERFALQELEDRKQFGLPPYRRLARLILRHPGETECAERAVALTHAIRSFAGSVEVRGPSVCPIARIAGKYRRQIELLSESAAEISRVLAEAHGISDVPAAPAAPHPHHSKR